MGRAIDDDPARYHPWRLTRLLERMHSDGAEVDVVLAASRTGSAVLPMEAMIGIATLQALVRNAEIVMGAVHDGAKVRYVHLGRDAFPSPYPGRGVEGAYAEMDGATARIVLVVSPDVPETMHVRALPFQAHEENLRQQTRCVETSLMLVDGRPEGFPFAGPWANLLEAPVLAIIEAIRQQDDAGSVVDVAAGEDGETPLPVMASDADVAAMLEKFKLSQDPGVRMRLASMGVDASSRAGHLQDVAMANKRQAEAEIVDQVRYEDR